MREFVGVRFRKAGKIYYFKSKGLKLTRGDIVIAETVRGLEYGTVEIEKSQIEDLNHPLKKVVRIATESDHTQYNNNKEKEREAFGICQDKIKKHGLDMKLIETELTFDCSKIMFYFTSENRVDFRKLVKELAAIFRMRIELRQIGVRDEAKALNSIGMCGRSLCCATFLGNFQPVSIKMAKDQSLSLNPSKISGVCGRLMCCLKYEEETYEALTTQLPKEGDLVKTPDGTGIVFGVSVLRQLVKVQIKSKDETVNINYYNGDEVKLVKKSNKTNEKLEKLEIDEELSKLIDE